MTIILFTSKGRKSVTQMTGPIHYSEAKTTSHVKPRTFNSPPHRCQHAASSSQKYRKLKNGKKNAKNGAPNIKTEHASCQLKTSVNQGYLAGKGQGRTRRASVPVL
ncbi:UNVERIFIED_CONTAM: hypothetical protein K2H54_066206 [Gekko kuhli]